MLRSNPDSNPIPNPKPNRKPYPNLKLSANFFLSTQKCKTSLMHFFAE